MSYEVQMSMANGDVWQNALSSVRDGISQSRTFATCDEAQEALDELLADIAADVADGLWAPWTADDFRIEWAEGGPLDTTRVISAVGVSDESLGMKGEL